MTNRQLPVASTWICSTAVFGMLCPALGCTSQEDYCTATESHWSTGPKEGSRVRLVYLAKRQVEWCMTDSPSLGVSTQEQVPFCPMELTSRKRCIGCSLRLLQLRGGGAVFSPLTTLGSGTVSLAQGLGQSKGAPSSHRHGLFGQFIASRCGKGVWVALR